jgi:hypothetical protein
MCWIVFANYCVYRREQIDAATRFMNTAIDWTDAMVQWMVETKRLSGGATVSWQAACSMQGVASLLALCDLKKRGLVVQDTLAEAAGAVYRFQGSTASVPVPVGTIRAFTVPCGGSVFVYQDQNSGHRPLLVVLFPNEESMALVGTRTIKAMDLKLYGDTSAVDAAFLDANVYVCIIVVFVFFLFFIGSGFFFAIVRPIANHLKCILDSVIPVDGDDDNILLPSVILVRGGLVFFFPVRYSQVMVSFFFVCFSWE